MSNFRFLKVYENNLLTFLCLLSKFYIPCSANKDYFDADPDPQFKNNECLDEEKKLNVDLELHL